MMTIALGIILAIVMFPLIAGILGVIIESLPSLIYVSLVVIAFYYNPLIIVGFAFIKYLYDKAKEVRGNLLV